MVRSVEVISGEKYKGNSLNVCVEVMALNWWPESIISMDELKNSSIKKLIFCNKNSANYCIN